MNGFTSLLGRKPFLFLGRKVWMAVVVWSMPSFFALLRMTVVGPHRGMYLDLPANQDGVPRHPIFC